MSVLSSLELQLSAQSFSTWQAILWCFYPFAVLVTLEFFARAFDDDDDGGKMIPILQTTN